MSTIKHDVDYSVKAYENKDEFTEHFDLDLMGGLANLEELHQLCLKNESLIRDELKWDYETIMSRLETIIELLRKV